MLVRRSGGGWGINRIHAPIAGITSIPDHATPGTNNYARGRTVPTLLHPALSRGTHTRAIMSSVGEMAFYKSSSTPSCSLSLCRIAGCEYILHLVFASCRIQACDRRPVTCKAAVTCPSRPLLAAPSGAQNSRATGARQGHSKKKRRRSRLSVSPGME